MMLFERKSPEGISPSRRTILGFLLGLAGSTAAPPALLAAEWGEDEHLVLHQGWVLRAGDLARLARA